jgi:hypothetical protein
MQAAASGALRPRRLGAWRFGRLQAWDWQLSSHNPLVGILPFPQVVRRIDVAARGVHWSEGGSLVAIASESSFYLLQYNRDVAESVLASGQVPSRAPHCPVSWLSGWSSCTGCCTHAAWTEAAGCSDRRAGCLVLSTDCWPSQQ